MLQYFEKISPVVESLWCALKDEAHIMGCWGPVTASKMAAIFGRHLEFYRKLEIVISVKTWNFFMLDM